MQKKYKTRYLDILIYDHAVKHGRIRRKPHARRVQIYFVAELD